MRWPIAALVAAFILQIFLAISPFVPGIAGIWESSSPQEFYSKLAVLIGIDFTLMTLAASLLFVKEFSDIKALRQSVIAQLPGVELRRLTADEFYDEFRVAVKSALQNVNICYFAPYPPEQVSTPDQSAYYRDLVKTIRQKKTVHFRRIIRDSATNKRWVGDLVKNLKNRKNAYIAVLHEDLTETIPMPLALSVQIIDGERTWLVALKTHEREGRYRDVFIRSRDFAEAMTDYYERLWAQSVVVLQNGQLTEKGRAYLDIESEP